MISDSGFVWSMNCDSCELPKNSLIAAEIGFALIRSCGSRFSLSAWPRRSFTARSTRTRPERNWFSASSPTERTRRLPRWSMSSISPRPLRSSTRILMTAMMSSLVSVAGPVSSVRPTRRLNFIRPTGRQVVALFGEEEAVEQRLDRHPRSAARRDASSGRSRRAAAVWSGVSSARSVCEMYAPWSRSFV